MKATRLMLAAALIVGSTGLAMAQGAGGAGGGGAGGGGEPPKASDANPPRAVKQQPGEAKSAPVNKGGSASVPMATKNTGMQKTPPAAAGAETGTAKDPAGPGAERKAPGSGVK